VLLLTCLLRTIGASPFISVARSDDAPQHAAGGTVDLSRRVAPSRGNHSAGVRGSAWTILHVGRAQRGAWPNGSIEPARVVPRPAPPSWHGRRGQPGARGTAERAEAWHGIMACERESDVTGGDLNGFIRAGVRAGAVSVG